MHKQIEANQVEKSDTIKSLPVSYEEWEYNAQQILLAGPFGYISGGAGSEETMRTNREAFLSWGIQPHLPRNVSLATSALRTSEAPPGETGFSIYKHKQVSHRFLTSSSEV